jgi:hypothetical protein
MKERPMITRSELAIVCRRLEGELQEAGYVFGEIQFYESEQTLGIVVDQEPNSQLCRLPRTAGVAEATVDARILWDVLRGLIKLGVKNPAIQFRRGNQDGRPTRKIRGGDDSRLACGFKGNALIGSPPRI